MTQLPYLLAAIWGGIWAAFLQYHPFGQFLALKRTWLTVVIGVGIDLLILLLVLDWQCWIKVFLVIALSSIFIIYRSLANELTEQQDIINVHKN